MDGLDAINRQDIAGWLARKLVRAVRGADRDGECVDASLFNEVGGLIGVSQQLLTRHCRFGTVAVLLVAAHRFERAKTAQFAFDGDADHMRQIDHFTGDIEIVFIAGDGFAIGLERAVHHHAGESQTDRLLAYRRALAVVLVHGNRHVWIGVDGGFNQILEESLTGIFARAGRGLHDYRAVGFGRRLHDRLHLLQIVYVEGGDTVAVFGGVVE